MAHDEGRRARPKWPEKLRADWIGLLGAAAPIAAALATTGKAQRFMIYLAAVFVVLLAAYLLVQAPWPVSSWRQTQEKAAPFLRKTLLPIATGASLTLAGGVLVITAANASENCSPPPGLRVMAAPENLHATTLAAEEF